MCAKVALVPLVFDPSLDWPFVLPKALLSHALTYVTAGVLLALLVRFGRTFVLWSWMHVPVLAFLALNVLATFFAVDVLLALYGTHARMLGLGTVADWVALYFAVVLLVRTRADGIAVVASAVCASALVLAYEMVQLAGLDPFRWSMNGAERPFSTIGQPTSLAQYLTTLAFGAAALALFGLDLGSRVRAALLLYAAVLLAGTALNGTRSALLGVATGSAFLIVAAVMTQRRRRLLTIGVLSGALVAGSTALILTPSLIGTRIASTVEALQAGESSEDLVTRLEPWGADRFALYQISTDIVRERPLLGYGPDGFAAGVPRHRPERAHPTIQQGVPTSGHSWISYTATSSGLLGLAAFLAIIAVAFSLALRGNTRATAVAAAAMIASFLGTGLTTVTEISTEWLFWAGLGTIALCTAPSRAGMDDAAVSRRRPARHSPARLSPRSIASTACVAAGVLTVFTLLGPVAASRSARASADSRLIGRVPQALELGLAATRSDPSRAAYWHVLGLAQVSAARWRDASATFQRAAALAPYDVRYVGDQSTAEAVLARSGDAASRARALQLADAAVRMDPNNPAAHTTRALVLQLMGDIQEALRSCERALELDPRSTNPRLYVIMAQVLLALGRPTDAVDAARRGITVFSVTPLSFDVRLELVRALLASGRRSDALAEIDLALTVRPNDPTALRLRAEALAGSGP